MTFGMVVLLVLSLLIIFGVGQRVLDRLKLNDKWALAAMLAIFIGGWIPAIPIGNVRIGIGGCLVPLALCIWVLVKAERGIEVARALFGALLTAAAVWLISLLMPADPQSIVFDPNYAYGLAAGVIAYILGRSRRAAFVCAVLGMLLADVVVGLVNASNGVDTLLRLGTGGALDAVVISGLLAVMLAEFMGELIERMVRGRRKERAK
ncbi:MAG: DUF1614 domain-containing protein [Oscillospiraceae bacterium]|jgi:hypothetical protein|nr:DUF1614 domain-containing protein [Oscillospiraceae bacterium]